MKKTLTKKGIDKYKKNPTKKRQTIADAATPGLYLIVQPSSVLSWTVWYRCDGAQRKFTLGRHSEEVQANLSLGDVINSPTPLSLPLARRIAGELFAAVGGCRDPAKERARLKLASKAQLPGSDLIESLTEKYLDQEIRSKASSYVSETERLIKKEILPVWGKLSIEDITPDHVVGLLADIVKRSISRGHRGTTANRTLAVMRPFFKWAVDWRKIATSPCPSEKALKRAKAQVEQPKRERTLGDDEIRWLWRACDKADYPFGQVYKLLLLTGQRRGEVVGMTRNEIDREKRLWVIPGSRTKNGNKHLVHLADTALGVLASVKNVQNDAGYLFCTNAETPVTGYSRAKTRLDVLMLEEARQEAAERGDDPDKVSLEHWTNHDLRRTLVTQMNETLRVLPHVVEAAVNHTSGQAKAGVAGVYNHALYLEDRERAFDAWARHIENLAYGAPDNVVPFGKRA